MWAFVIGGMCAGAASVHAAHLPTSLSFTFPACLPLAASLLLNGNVQGIAAGSMILVFLAMMTFTAILFSREFGRSLELKYALEFRAVELDDANSRLKLEIEDHRSTSEALYQSQKMEALGSLTGGFAHDFNNLLTVILGNLDRIVSRSEQSQVRDMARSAIVAAESGASLTSRLLAFARKQALNPKMVNLNDVLIEFRDFLMPALTGSIRVEFAISEQAAIVPLDAAHFQAALLNLVVNARDAMPDGGLITISASRVSLDSAGAAVADVRSGDFVAVAVADSGEGMSPEALERAFEPYFTTKAGRGGTGLGLSQVHGFAHQSGGFVRITSEPGQGTCATLFIPLGTNSLPVGNMAESKTVTKPTQSLSILIVDDNPAALGALEADLADHGWNATTAIDGKTALDIIESGKSFDIVVTDIDMPGELDGLKLATELRLKRPHLPVLLISGAPIPVDKMDADIPFLAKPFRKHIFLERIQAAIDQSNLDGIRY